MPNCNWGKILKGYKDRDADTIAFYKTKGIEWVDPSRRWEYAEFVDQASNARSFTCFRIVSAVWLLLGDFNNKLSNGLEEVQSMSPQERADVYEIAYYFVAAPDKRRFIEKYNQILNTVGAI